MKYFDIWRLANKLDVSAQFFPTVHYHRLNVRGLTLPLMSITLFIPTGSAFAHDNASNGGGTQSGVGLRTRSYTQGSIVPRSRTEAVLCSLHRFAYPVPSSASCSATYNGGPRPVEAKDGGRRPGRSRKPHLAPGRKRE